MMRLHNDIIFMLKAVAIAAVITLGLQLIGPYIQPAGEPASQEAQAFVDDIVPVSAGDIPEKVSALRGKPVFVMVYASWCGVCRQVMPEIKQALDEGKFSHAELLFLSVDRNFQKMSNYLVESGLENAFTPYMVKNSAFDRLDKAMQRLRSSYQNRIPYMAYIDADGKIAAESQGLDWSSVRNALAR